MRCYIPLVIAQRRNMEMNKIVQKAQKAGIDGFFIGLLCMIGLAYIWPDPGMASSPIPLTSIATYAVSVIFFFYGLKLSPDKLKAGLVNWRLHVLVHVSSFILFPLMALAMKPFFQGSENELLWLGIFFMAVLPSTVSSSVVMVSIAKGNVPAAIFNASLSSLLGVFITPLWMGLVMEAENGAYDLGSVVGKLAIQVLVPVILGLMLNKKWGATADRYKHQIKLFDQSSILLIVYTSFCESFGGDFFKDFHVLDIVFLGFGMVLFFFVIYFLLNFLSNFLQFNRADRITLLFCGSKKSLVQGAVMSKVLFSGSQVGVILLPIMVFHALQLIVVSMLAQRFAAETEEVI